MPPTMPPSRVRKGPIGFTFCSTMADIGEKLYFITMPELPWEPEAGSIARI